MVNIEINIFHLKCKKHELFDKKVRWRRRRYEGEFGYLIERDHLSIEPTRHNVLIYCTLSYVTFPSCNLNPL